MAFAAVPLTFVETTYILIAEFINHPPYNLMRTLNYISHSPMSFIRAASKCNSIAGDISLGLKLTARASLLHLTLI